MYMYYYSCASSQSAERTFHEAQADVAELRELVELLVAVPLLQRELQLLAKHVEVVDQEARRRRHLTDLRTLTVLILCTCTAMAIRERSTEYGHTNMISLSLSVSH